MVLRSLALQPLHGYALATRIQQRSRELLQVERRISLPGAATAAQGWSGRCYVDLADQSPGPHLLAHCKRTQHLARETAVFDQMVEGIQFVLDSD